MATRTTSKRGGGYLILSSPKGIRNVFVRMRLGVENTTTRIKLTIYRTEKRNRKRAGMLFRNRARERRVRP